MKQNDTIGKELQDLNSALPVNRQMPYLVPSGYFEGLVSEIILQMRTADKNAAAELSVLSPYLDGLDKKMPFEVSSGYFDELPSVMLNAVKNSNRNVAEELEELSPFLSSLEKKNPYQVPASYFEKNREASLTKDEKAPAKVLKFNATRWIRYAAAAVIIGMIAWGGSMIFSSSQNLQGLSLVKYEKKLNKEIKKMSDQELDDFLQYTEAGLDGTEKVSNKPAIEAKDFLKDVPDEELNEFLEETSVTVPEAEGSLMN